MLTSVVVDDYDRARGVLENRRGGAALEPGSETRQAPRADHDRGDRLLARHLDEGLGHAYPVGDDERLAVESGGPRQLGSLGGRAACVDLKLVLQLLRALDVH